jgi:sugar phosphate isomerase/epimerase
MKENSFGNRTPSEASIHMGKARHSNLIGAQLILWGEELVNNFEMIVSLCSRLGYSCLEAPAMIYAISADYAHEVTSRLKMPLYAIHVGYPDIADPRELDKRIEYLNCAGVPVLIASGISKADSLEAYDESAKVFNSVGKKCQEMGIKFYYHTHWWEFIIDDIGERAINRLLTNTDPLYVKFNLDICWAQAGGEKPIDAMNLLGDRCDYYHIKDGILGESPAAVSWRPLGKGDIQVDVFIRELINYRRDYKIVVEQDEPYKTAEADMDESIKYLRSLFEKYRYRR